MKPAFTVILSLLLLLAPVQASFITTGSSSLLFVQTNRVTVNSAGAQTLTGTGAGSTTLAANYFGTAGNVLRFDVKGFGSTSATPGTFNIKVSLGGTSICSGSILIPASNTNFGWTLEGQIIDITTGSSGTVACGGAFTQQNQSSTTTTALGLSTFTTPVTINTTTTLAVDVVATWNTFSSGDTVTSVVYILRSF